VALCLCLLSTVARAAVNKAFMAGSSPVIPLIIDPAAPSADTSEADVLANMERVFAREPAAASGPVETVEDNPFMDSLESEWDGVSYPEPEEIDGSEEPQDSAAAALAREISTLNELINKGNSIITQLPSKKARLAELQKEMLKKGGAQAAKHAAKKLAVEQRLLSDIDGKIGALQEKLDALKDARTRLQASITAVEAAIKAGGGAPAAPPAAEASATEPISEAGPTLAELEEWAMQDF